VESGKYENASEVVRAALRALDMQERRYEAKLAVLRAAIEDGLRSGIVEGDPFTRIRKKYNWPERT
jgi:antitoxin ParD1/3/4